MNTPLPRVTAQMRSSNVMLETDKQTLWVKVRRHDGMQALCLGGRNLKFHMDHKSPFLNSSVLLMETVCDYLFMSLGSVTFC